MRRWMRLHSQAGRSAQKKTPSFRPALPTLRVTLTLVSILTEATMRSISSTTRLTVSYSRSGST